MAEDLPASEAFLHGGASGDVSGGSSHDDHDPLMSDPTALLAPSDFLPDVPPSTETPSTTNNVPAAGDGHHETLPPPKSSTNATALDAHGKTLNPRSCVTCRKRKVKCDKLWPCNNCNRAHIECVFPAPGRGPRKPRKLGEGKDKELLERLRKLESVVKNMGAELPGEEAKDSNHEKAREVASPSASPVNSAETVPAARDAEEEFQSKTRWVEEQQRGRFENRFGRLVVNEGKSRYINNSFWANLSTEVEDLKGILNQSSDDEEDHLTASPGLSEQTPNAHHAFIFGFSSQNVDILRFHPPPAQIKRYWDIFKDRVDPLCKVLHVPTLEGTIISAASHLTNLSRGFECLLFAIYYGATTSLSAQDCLIKLGEEKAVLLTRYRFAIEQALARVNFLTTEEIGVLQSFVIFLICLRRNSDARVIWTLTGLVVRIAQTIGIHRDGSHFGLSPFEVEMRRRLWWQVCILDTRASEDHGCDPTIVEQSFDTKMPLNINDEDMSPDMEDFPPERQGCTIMSFCLLRFDVANTFRRINYIPPGTPNTWGEHYQSVTLQDKQRWITECHKRLEERYLKNCDMTVPLFWVTATVARLMMSKMWLMVYHPFQRQDGGASLSENVKEKLFITSLENMEYSLLLENEARTRKWGWLFRTYIQWHALAFTLSELCHRTSGDMVERAWKAVDRTLDGRSGLHAETGVGHLWRPLTKLYRKAKQARAQGIQREQLARQRSGSVPMRHYSPNANPMFGHPSRPVVTRAPLSFAQLQRLHQGPTFGRTPLDKHELLSSPDLNDVGKSRSAADTNTHMLNQVHQPKPNTTTPLTDTSTSVNTAALAAPLPRTAPPHNVASSRNFGDPMSTMNFDEVTADPFTTTSSMEVTANVEQTSSAANGSTRVNSFETMDNDLSNVDSSGNMDWENWDQLVRQFGMDMDSGAVDVDLTGANWDGADWDMTTGTTGSSNANSKTGFGISGPEWF